MEVSKIENNNRYIQINQGRDFFLKPKFLQKKQKGIYSNILYLIFFDDMSLFNSHNIHLIDAHKRLHFIKNEEGEWIPHQLSEQEREERQQQEEIKERGICIVHTPGHAIWDTAERILANLNLHHELPLQVVIFSQEEHIPSSQDNHKVILVGGKWYTPLSQRHIPLEDATLAWLVQRINEDMIMQTDSIRDDIQQLFFDLKAKPYHAPTNHVSKTQKSKAKIMRKHNQKKK